MKQQKCLLCGHEYPTGLHILGCLICFPCEKRILSDAPCAARPAPRALLKLYRRGADSRTRATTAYIK